MLQFQDATGRLTAYAFACGYVERKGSGGNRSALLLQHGVYYVKGFRNGVHFWKTFDQLVNARKFFDREANRA